MSILLTGSPGDVMPVPRRRPGSVASANESAPITSAAIAAALHSVERLTRGPAAFPPEGGKPVAHR